MIFLMCVASSEITLERPDLGSGAGGRRQRDEIAAARARSAGLAGGPMRTRARRPRDCHQRDRLGDIERRAAAESDDRIGTMRLERG